MSNKVKKYYIFGVHSRGQTLWVYLRTLHPDWEFMGFLYDNDERNPDNIDGDRVSLFTDKSELDIGATVYIATRGVYHDRITKRLLEYGFREVVPVDAGLDIELRNKFVPEYFRQHGWEFGRIDGNAGITEDRREDGAAYDEHMNKAEVYVVRSAVDSLLSQDVALNKYEEYIQAGTALSDAEGKNRISDCKIFDDFGDNISARNRQMCELTALYWIWKNSDCDIAGLEHYRRRFILPDNWMNAFRDISADVILPTPLYVHPSLKGNYCARHIGKIWDCMIDVLGELHPKCVDSAIRFFEDTGCYSPCNMLIARREVLDELCDWLFPVLFEVMDRCGTLEDAYQNRYPGFLSERLLTFFFHLNSEKYKILYADKTFLR